MFETCLITMHSATESSDSILFVQVIQTVHHITSAPLSKSHEEKCIKIQAEQWKAIKTYKTINILIKKHG